jgi:outer membrane protein
MKNIRFNKILILFFLLPLFGIAQQKIGFMDSESIMKQLPEAQDAQKKIDILIQNWKDDIADMEKDWKTRFDAYDKRKLIMSDQSRANTEKELQELDKKIMDYRTQKFGQNGELSKKQLEVVKPIQDKIYQALQEIAKEDSYDFVFDKSGQLSLLITNDKFDLTTKVLDRFNKLKTSIAPAK